MNEVLAALVVLMLAWCVGFGFAGVLVANRFGLPRSLGALAGIFLGVLGLVVLWGVGTARLRRRGYPDHRLALEELPEPAHAEQPTWVPPTF